MKFDLSSYSDLGKCATGTLIDEWDTERHFVYFIKNAKEDSYNPFEVSSYELFTITNLKDLFKILWTIPTIITGNRSDAGKAVNFYITNKDPWWKSSRESFLDPDKEKKRLARYEKGLKKVKAKIAADNSL